MTTAPKDDLPATVETAVDRTKFIGGSDMPALLGLAPSGWERNTPVALWKDKTTPRVEGERPTTGVKLRGKRWEGAVAEMLVDELQRLGHKVEIVRSNTRYTDPTVPYFACEIDFEVRLDDEPDITNVELKTVTPFLASKWEESGTNAPVYYEAQAMWGLGITGRDKCLIAALFGADELRVYPLMRDNETILGLRARAADFWTNHVLTGIAPPPMKLSDLNLIYPNESDGPALLADEELTAKVLRLRAIEKEIKAREAEADLLEFEVKRAMKDASELIVNGASAITWKQRANSYLDQAALKEAHPKLVKEFTRKGSSRVFTLKQFGWKETP